jgi:hypothetical protein
VAWWWPQRPSICRPLAAMASRCGPAQETAVDGSECSGTRYENTSRCWRILFIHCGGPMPSHYLADLPVRASTIVSPAAVTSGNSETRRLVLP